MVPGGEADAIIAAAEDAVKDGMDVLSLSIGGPAFTGPLDTGAACANANGGAPNPPGVACDLVAVALENAARSGTVVVVAAGNSGESGVNTNVQTLNSIGSPAYAPSVIAAGATTNSHAFISLVSVSGAGVPGRLSNITATPAPTSAPDSSVTAPLVDVTQPGNDGLACTSLPAGSLNGALALIERGSCLFSVKMSNAVAAGALGVVFYLADQSSPFPAGGLNAFLQPAVMISNRDGASLKTFIDANAGHAVTLSPLAEQPLTIFNQLAGFSSAGPSLGLNGIKPEVLAPGVNMYMPTQSYDPLGELYSASRFTVADGTSYSTPLTAGAAALVKQNHPGYTAAQVKSALVNTATQDVTLDQFGDALSILQTGGGKVAADFAIGNNITVTPPTVSFGVLSATPVGASQQFQVTNTGTTAVTLSLAVVSTTVAGGTSLALGHSSLALAAGASGTFTLTLSGTLPPAGLYSGTVTVQGASQTTRIPYMFLVGSGTIDNLIPLAGDGNDGTVNQVIPDGYVAFQLIDANGVPVTGAPVTFTADKGVTLSQVSAATDAGPYPGDFPRYRLRHGELLHLVLPVHRLQPPRSADHGRRSSGRCHFPPAHRTGILYSHFWQQSERQHHYSGYYGRGSEYQRAAPAQHRFDPGELRCPHGRHQRTWTHCIHQPRTVSGTGPVGTGGTEVGADKGDHQLHLRQCGDGAALRLCSGHVRKRWHRDCGGRCRQSDHGCEPRSARPDDHALCQWPRTGNQSACERRSGAIHSPCPHHHFASGDDWRTKRWNRFVQRIDTHPAGAISD